MSEAAAAGVAVGDGVAVLAAAAVVLIVVLAGLAGTSGRRYC